MSKQLKSQARNSYFYPRHNFLHHTFKQLPNKHQTSTNCAWRAKYHFPVTLKNPQPKAAKCEWAGPSCLMVHAQCRLTWRWWLAAIRRHSKTRRQHQKAVKNAIHGGLHEHGGARVRVTQLQVQTNTSNGPLSVCTSKEGWPSQQTHIRTILIYIHKNSDPNYRNNSNNATQVLSSFVYIVF